MVASVLNVSEFPPTTSTKWQRYSQDININDTRYNGSTEDLVAPKLVINKVNFDNDHGAEYRCVATNSEGSWTSSSTMLYLEGSMSTMAYLILLEFLKRLKIAFKQQRNSNCFGMLGNYHTIFELLNVYSTL